jgi:cellulose synthase/poly-beta-1,6-N-acetylglucosamine synthase-like glycosyltransferase
MNHAIVSETLWVLLLVGGAVLAIFVAHAVLLCLLSLYAHLFRRGRAPARMSDVRFAVIVPAHNEEKLIAGTVRSILQADYLDHLIKLVVIADNCVDGTARVARDCGATCLERKDDLRRGKPYALEWAIERLDLDCHDALVVIDADTRIDPMFFDRMAAHLGTGTRALQGYFGVSNPDQSWLTRLSLLPAALKYRLCFPGKELVGMSCPLAGNGMCFEIGIIREFGWKAYSVTENWEYWAQLALRGICVGVAADAVIYSEVAKTLSSGESQRMRWMKGRIGTLRDYGARLLVAGLREPSLLKIDAVIELARPSHAMLFFWSLAYLAVTLPLAQWDAGFVPLAVLAAVIVGLQALYFLAGFLWDRPPLSAWLALVMVPWYLAWKLLVSIRAILTLRDRKWIRTRRND